MIIYFAYGLFIISFILKVIGLYLLSAKKEKPFEERRKAYNKFNRPSNILLIRSRNFSLSMVFLIKLLFNIKKRTAFSPLIF